MANDFLRLSCPYCGGSLSPNGELYRCGDCGNRFEKKKTETDSEKIRSILDEMKAEQVANIRRRLWEETHKEYISSDAILDAAQKILDILPEDRFANFYKAAVSEGYEELNRFLDNFDASNTDDLPLILDFSVKVMEELNINSVKALVERGLTGEAKIDYYSKIEAEAEKIQSGIYNTDVPRTVFLAYSSKDMKKVNEVAAYLESQGFSCFVALRNLRHGKGAKENYQAEIMNAIANCKCVVFISSENSRAMTCDAMRIEIPFLRKTYPDKPHIEFLIEDYGKKTGEVASEILKDYFRNLEYCTTLKDLGVRVLNAEADVNTGATALSKQQEELMREMERVKEQQQAQAESLARRLPDNIDTITPLLQRARMCCEDGDFEKADGFAEQVLNRVPQEAEAYVIKLMVERKVKKQDDLALLSTLLEDSKNFQRALKFADAALAKTLRGYNETIKARIEERKEAAERKTKAEADRKAKEEVERKERAIAESLHLSFKKDGEGYKICGLGTCQNKDLIIPSFYNSLPITRIDNRAFYECSSLESITIPSGVKNIEKEAFYKCSNLATVTFAEDSQCSSIGEYAFSLCSSLTSITIPSSVTSIGKGAFCDCNSLQYNEYNGGKYLGNASNPYYALIEGTGTSGIHNATKVIAGSAFFTCHCLESITIPSSVTSIGDWTFYNCSSLTSITIPSGVKNIGSYAFSDCSNLKTVTFAENSQCESIGENAFSECKNLESIMIPSGVKSIADRTFENFTNLRTVTFMEGSECESIGFSAFYGCKNLESITIPSGVKEIGRYAFGACSNLATVTFAENSQCSSIGSSAFYWCSSLTSITIPSSVTSIGDHAFYYCSSLTSINFLGTKAQWKAILKEEYWNSSTGSYSIYFGNGAYVSKFFSRFLT